MAEEIYEMIKKISSASKIFSQITISTAMVYFHRFIIKKMNENIAEINKIDDILGDNKTKFLYPSPI